MSKTSDTQTQPRDAPDPDRATDEELLEYLMQRYEGETVGRIARLWYEAETQDSTSSEASSS